MLKNSSQSSGSSASNISENRAVVPEILASDGLMPAEGAPQCILPWLYQTCNQRNTDAFGERMSYESVTKEAKSLPLAGEGGPRSGSDEVLPKLDVRIAAFMKSNKGCTSSVRRELAFVLYPSWFRA